MILTFKVQVLMGVRKGDLGNTSREYWTHIIIHRTKLNRYRKTADVSILRQDIEAKIPGVAIPMAITWISAWKVVNARWEKVKYKLLQQYSQSRTEPQPDE